jgi:osmotically-inducible protein OsmY
MIKGVSRLLLAAVLATSLSGCTALFLSGAATTIGVIHDRRSAGTILDDRTIELTIYGRIANDPQLARGANISVSSYNNVVLLSGQVIDPGQRQRAQDVAANAANVRRVFNELEVAPPANWSNTGTDALISSMVKGSLFQVQGLADFDPTRVKVVTDRGTVYLMGLLRPEEADAVTATVRRVNGVQRVVKLFEYI